LKHSGKVAVVTGGGSGIGRAVALQLASEGATVVLNGRDPVKLSLVAEEIAQANGHAVVRPGDITQRTEIKALIDGIGTEFGRIDFAFNNAGGHADFKPLHTVSDDESEWIIDLNFKAVYFCMAKQLDTRKNPSL